MPPLLYRVFSSPLTVFFGLVLVGALVAAAPRANAQAAGDQYMVRGISVDVSGTSALDARNKAFVEARRKAYEQLGAQLLTPADRPNLVVPDDRTIASLVRDFEIVNEKMTTRRYAGTVNVRFTPAAVKRTMQVAAAGAPPVTDTAPAAPERPQDSLAQNAAPQAPAAQTPAGTRLPARSDDPSYVYTPRQPGSASAPAGAVPARAASAQRRLLILPWYGPMGRQTLWGQGNPWRAAWEENAGLSRDKTIPILLPVGDVDDLRDYAPPQPLSRRGDIDALLRRYHASEAVLALAEPNSDGGVIVSLYRYENGTPVPLGRFGVDTSSRDVLGDAVAKAAASLRATPPRNVPAPVPVSIGAAPSVGVPPAAQSAVPGANVMAPVGGTFRTLVRFTGLQQWVAMRQALTRVPGMGPIDIRAISPSQASIEFAYGGDYAALASSMAQQGLTFAPLPAGAPVPVSGGYPPQYVLSAGGVY